MMPSDMKNVFQFPATESVVISFKDGGARELLGPGRMSVPNVGGVMHVRGFEAGEERSVLVSLLNPNIVSVDVLPRR